MRHFVLFADQGHESNIKCNMYEGHPDRRNAFSVALAATNVVGITTFVICSVLSSSRGTVTPLTKSSQLRAALIAAWNVI
jgi:hypothetical protein